jgi:uncharacterized membrane protein (DUF2068 family)
MKKKLKLPLPTVRWDLISCGFNGHFLVGTDARTIREEDSVFAREHAGLRHYRCLRCNSWVIKKAPRSPTRDTPPSRDDIELPIRGRLLRDHYVLRLIAVDRAVHVVILSSIAILLFLFASHQSGLRSIYFQILQGFQGVNSSLIFSRFLENIQGVFDFKPIHIVEVGFIVTALALIEAIEMVGLWRGRRWAEYLTFVATILFIPYEIYELLHGVSVVKLVAFAINVAIAVYLLYAKRLFGVNGGAKGDRRDQRIDIGWAWLERTSPKP